MTTQYREKQDFGDTYTTLDVDSGGEVADEPHFPLEGPASIRVQNDSTSGDIDVLIEKRHTARARDQSWGDEVEELTVSTDEIVEHTIRQADIAAEYRIRCRASSSGGTGSASASVHPLSQG